MFTAQLLGITRNKLKTSVNIRFADGTETIEKNYEFPLGLTSVQIKRSIKSDLDSLNQGTPSIASGTIDFSDTVVSQTQEEIDRNTWISNYRRLEKSKNLVTLGVLTGSEPALTSLLGVVQNNFDQAYIDYI